MLSNPSSSQNRAATEQYRVGDLEVDVQARRVVRGGEEVHLTELSFDVLVTLLRRAPAIVSKKTLMREVWPDIVVEPETVKKRIGLLRSALNDDDPECCLIRVARGRGYGINANVERLDLATQPSRLPRPRRMTIVLAGSAFVISMIAIGIVLRSGSDGGRQSTELMSTATVDEARKSGQENTDASSPWTDEIDPVAYRLYLEGKRLRRTGHDFIAASTALERAVDIEPQFSAALAELALCRIGGPVTAATGQLDGPNSARDLARRALQLDPTLPEAVAASVAVAIFVDWNWTEARALLEQGLSVAPGNEYLLVFSSLLSAIHGDLDKSIRLLAVAAAHDVTYARLHYLLGQRYYQAKRFREAIEAYRHALAVNPRIEFAHLAIGRIRALQGDHAGALHEIELEPNPVFRLYGLVIAHTAAGEEPAAIEALEDFETLSQNCCDYWLGTLHAFRGDADTAFRFLESAWTSREQGLLDLGIDPILEGVRDDPRYVDLVARLDLN
jgi:DNA-binding winged helix-turn-helix (wHTH) protein/tetratricopeptide (TPR) repeat protein